MSSATYKIAIVQLLELVAWPEIKHLRKRMREVEGGTELDIHILPCLGSEDNFFTNVLLEIGHFGPFYKRLNDSIAERFFFNGPVNFRLLIWHWNEDIN